MPIRRTLFPIRIAYVAMLTTTLSWAQTEAENADEKATPTPTSIEERVGDLERRLEAAEQRATAAEKATHEAEAQLKTTEAKNTEIQAKQTELQGRVEEAEQAAQANEAVLSDLLAHSEDTELLRLYGFADIGWRVLRLDSGSTMRNIQDVPNQFVLGNANLYVDARPSSRFRSLMEIRFTTYPGGTYASQATTPTNTSIMDVNSTTARNKVQLSNIIIERVQMEYKQSDALNLTVGYFLTPYGIWNIDHGTPTLISLALPGFFAAEFFPTHSLGVQLSGSTANDTVEAGYYAYVTNGRSPVQGDIDNAKNVGGRLYLTFTGDNPLTLGASGFRGTYKETVKDLDFTRDPPMGETVTVASKEWGLGADLSWDAGPLRLRTEWVGNQTTYKHGKRPTAIGGYAPDQFQWGAYTILAYQLPYWYLEPYIYAEYTNSDMNLFNQLVSRGVSTASAGLNVNFSATTKVKAQYFRVNFYDKKDGQLTDGFSAFDIRLVAVF